MSEMLRHAVEDVLRETYTREECQRHVDQLKERVTLRRHAPPERQGLLTQGIELNLRGIEICRELYPAEYEPHQIFGKEQSES